MVDTLLVCDLCGNSHITSTCDQFEPKIHLHDSAAPSRAGMTLPSELHLTESDGIRKVITLLTLQEGTQFGPFQAPRREKLKVQPKLPFLIIDSESVVEYLDTSDENICNWMCLVRSASSLDESNITAFQGDKDIFFRTKREIKDGEELLVFYSIHYSKKIDYIFQCNNFEEAQGECGKCPTHSPRLTMSEPTREPDGNKKFISAKVKRKRGRPAKATDYNIHLPPGSTRDKEVRLLPNESISVPNKDKWKCSQCSLVYSDGLKFARHFQTHFNAKCSSSKRKLKVGSPTDGKILQKSNNETKEFKNDSEVKPNNSVKGCDNLVQCSVAVRKLSDSVVHELETLGNILCELPSDRNISPESDSCFSPDKGVALELPNSQDSVLNTNKSKDEMVENTAESMTAENTSSFQTSQNVNTYNLRAQRKGVIIYESEDIESCSDQADNFEQFSDSDTEFKIEIKKKPEVPAKCSEENVSKCPLVPNQDFSETIGTQELSNKQQDKSDALEKSTSNLTEDPELEFNMTTSNGEISSTQNQVTGVLNKPGKNFAQNRSSSVFKCDICGKMFSSSFYLFRHTKKHTGDFSCFCCKKAFARKESLLKHNCQGKQSYHCTRCKRTFCSKSLLKKHMNLHDRPFICKECKKDFTTKDMLLKHACIGSQQKVKCPVCKKEFANLYLMTKHLPVHTGQFSCPLCSKWLCSSSAAYSHLLICKDVKEIADDGSKKCPTCNQEFTTIKDYRSHEFTHTHSFECKHCNGHFISVIKLQNHQCINIKVPCTYCNKTFDSIPAIKNHSCAKFQKPFQCMLCKSWFERREDLQQHKCTCDIATLKNFLSYHKGDLLVCEQCGKTFASISSLNAHKALHGDRKFSCAVCDKKFFRNDLLQSHSLMHAGPTVPCDRCGKLFKCKRSLMVHLRTHSGEKPFSCSICFKAFNQKGNLLKHQATHIRDRMFVCNECDKVYKSNEAFMKHKKEHQQAIALSCIHCNRTFTDKSQLKCHMNETHLNQAYTCKYCGITTTKCYSLKRHLRNKHPELESEWKNSGVNNYSVCSWKGQKPGKRFILKVKKNAQNASSDEADTQEISYDKGETMLVTSGLDEESQKLGLVEDLLCVEEVVQSNLDITSSIQDSSDLHLGPSELETSLEFEDNVQKQVVVSNTIELNDHQIEELRQKFQEDHTGTVILDDGTVIQQQPAMCGSNDVIFYVIPKETIDN